jgi:hypothetical protein
MFNVNCFDFIEVLVIALDLYNYRTRNINLLSKLSFNPKYFKHKIIEVHFHARLQPIHIIARH